MLGKEVNSVEGALMLLAGAKEPCLLFLDNADDPNFDYNIYLPSGMQGSVIMTSRVADCTQHSTIGWEALTSLDEEDCRELLFKAARIPKEQWEAHTEAAKNLVRLLESHTLALIQAGAYIAKGHCTLSDYMRIFQQQRKRLLEYRPTQAQSRYCDVYATFEASAEVLSEDALQLLGVLSVLRSSFLSVGIFESAWVGSRRAARVKSESEAGFGDLSQWDVTLPPESTGMSNDETGLDVLNEWHVSQLPAFIGAESHQWDSYRLQEAIYLLKSLSLVTTVEQDGVRGMSMHPLAHAWAKDRQKPEGKKRSWLAAGSIIALSVLGSTTRDRLDRHLQPHIQSYVDEKTQNSITCGSQRNMLALLWSCSWMLMRMRDDLRLQRLLRELFREAGLDSARPKPRLVPLYHLLAQSHFFNGHCKAAVNIIGKVVEIRRETLVEMHANLLSAQHLQAVAFAEDGQIKEAVTQLEWLVKIRQTTLAETHPYVLDAQLHLAYAYHYDGQIKEAIKLLEHVVKIRETMLAETHPDRLTSQHNLASAYQANGQIEEAVKLLEHVVKIEETMLAETHPDRLVSQHSLAVAYEANGQIEEAVKLLEHVVRVDEATLTERHPNRLASQRALARVLDFLH